MMAPLSLLVLYLWSTTPSAPRRAFTRPAERERGPSRSHGMGYDDEGVCPARCRCSYRSRTIGRKPMRRTVPVPCVAYGGWGMVGWRVDSEAGAEAMLASRKCPCRLRLAGGGRVGGVYGLPWPAPVSCGARPFGFWREIGAEDRARPEAARWCGLWGSCSDLVARSGNMFGGMANTQRARDGRDYGDMKTPRSGRGSALSLDRPHRAGVASGCGMPFLPAPS